MRSAGGSEMSTSDPECDFAFSFSTRCLGTKTVHRLFFTFQAAYFNESD